MTDQGADRQIDEPVEILRSARERALGRRPGLRMIAITAWSAFIGAVVLFTAYLLEIPDDGALDLGRLASVFVVIWALAAIPALSAVLLAFPSPAAFDPPRKR